MTRFAAIVIALFACAVCLEAALYSAGLLGPWLQSHMAARWFAPASNLFVTGCVLFVALRDKKPAVEEHERPTPLVRRDPKTGLRLL